MTGTIVFIFCVVFIIIFNPHHKGLLPRTAAVSPKLTKQN